MHSLKQNSPSLTHREQIVLAALAPAFGKQHTPVQVQKLLFLLDQEIPRLIGGPVFRFAPYDYGPFDKDVYDTLETLADSELIIVQWDGTMRRFSLTPAGQDEGDRSLSKLDEKARDYIREASNFVRSLSFSQLVSAIYRAYPDMRVNSIFGKASS